MPQGRKRRFSIAGVANILITNLVLQALLASNTISIVLSTLISQLINTVIGYLIYGKFVFKADGLRSHRPVLKYLCLMAALWMGNSGLIGAASYAGVQKNLAAAAAIPVLAMVSYLTQKRWVFRREA